jgi:hypothetical protein
MTAMWFVVGGCTHRPPELDGMAYRSGIGGVRGGTRSGPCSNEGATVACHVETGRSGSIVNCFSGTQTCLGGEWSSCGGGSGATLSTVSLSTNRVAAGADGVGLALMAVTTSDPSASSGGCASNPCNPYCIGVDVDAGLVGPVIVQGVVDDLSSFPSSKVAASAPTCTQGAPPQDLRACSYDYCCSSATNTCVRSTDPVVSAACTKPATADYTAGLGCRDALGYARMPICNRGNADSPVTGKLAVMGYSGNPPVAGPPSPPQPSVCQNVDPSPPEGCLIDLAINPIKSNGCIMVDVFKGATGASPGIVCQGTADFNTGNRTVMVNPPSTTLPSALAANNGGVAAYTQLAEGNACNNFSFVHAVTNSCVTYTIPPPMVSSYTYAATCSEGSRPRWNQFAYTTTVPDASSVLFSMSTATPLSDGGAGTFTAPVTAANPATPTIVDPAVCPISGGPSCPKSLAAVLGSANAENPLLKVDLTLTTTSATPTVSSWQVNYNCLPVE